MDRTKIEKQARLVQYEIWHNRDALFPLGVPSPRAPLASNTRAIRAVRQRAGPL